MSIWSTFRDTFEQHECELFLLLHNFLLLHSTGLCSLIGDVCSTKYNPVCGSDGTTYSNRCELGKVVCAGQTDLRILYAGECAPGKCNGRSFNFETIYPFEAVT